MRVIYFFLLVFVLVPLIGVAGPKPGILVTGIDYGTHLHATTADSFFVVKNTGSSEWRLEAHAFDHGNSKDSASFELHQYYPPNSDTDYVPSGSPFLFYDIN